MSSAFLKFFSFLLHLLFRLICAVLYLMSRSYHSKNHLSILFSKFFYFSFAADIYNIIKENERSNRRQIIKPPARQPAQDSRKRWTGSDPRTARKRHRQPQRAAQWQYIGIMPHWTDRPGQRHKPPHMLTRWKGSGRSRSGQI